MSKVGRSRSIPAGPALKRTVRSLTRAQMYRPQIGLKLGMEKRASFPFGCDFTNGLTIVTTSTSNITVIYE